MIISNRVSELRKLMAEKQISAYIVPSADNHQSEYTGEHFKTRAYLSGFTGSAGTVVITKNDAGLWTDGRYFIQAQKQLAGSGIRLFKMGEPGVPTVEEFLYSSMDKGSKLGFDGRVIAAEEGKSLQALLSQKDIDIVYDVDLVGDIWKDRPAISVKPAFLLDTKYSGESFSSKLARLREKMSLEKASVHIITSLDDIAWLFNIRGEDVTYSPLVLSYAVVSTEEVFLFIDPHKLGPEIREELAKENVTIKPYNDVYEFVKNLKEDSVVMIDPKKINYAISKNIPPGVKQIEMPNPTYLFKAIKNNVELENMRKSQIKDGIAFAKFMDWLKENIGKIEITEISASDKLDELRAEQGNYIGPSFAPISAYKENAAMMHYSAEPESCYTLKPEHLYLTDTGANYYEGTTDITRTIALGEISQDLKTHFTAVLRGMINLSMAKFLYGVKGYNLDVLARQPIWQLGIDYKCGTGHGVGYLLNIHEGPSGFRWQVVPSKNETAVIEPGMVLTNEPGIYIENSHGIRIENELIAKKSDLNEFGQFMEFEVITFIPIDLDAVDPSQLTYLERNYLNSYHEMVYEKISPHLNDSEMKWLKHYTRSI